MADKDNYKHQLHALQIELVKLQKHFIKCDDKILVLLEGRDAAGKDGAIKRITKHLSPRETRVVALGKPSDREAGSWYFQRYVRYLPVPQEFVLFNRSWYNRAGVERVMGFCTEGQLDEFFSTVNEFELLLVRSGIKLLKYYLDLSKDEQRKRLADRKRDPLKQWKQSPIDAKAIEKWKDYTDARDEMLERTNTKFAPWTIIKADDKKQARLNLIRDLLSRLTYNDKNKTALRRDPKIVFPFDRKALNDGRLAR